MAEAASVPIILTPYNELNDADNDEDTIIKKQNSRSTNNSCTIFLMTAIVVTGPLSTESQVPALNNIKQDFDTTTYLVQLSITIYMLIYGLSQLFFGTISDVYGRKKVLIFGLILYCSMSVGCAASPSIYILIICRAIMAIGCGIGNVIVYAVIRDLFQEREKRTFYISMIGGIKPVMIASSPIFGGIVTNYLGSWRFIFWIISGMALILLIISITFFPETNPQINLYRNKRRSTINFKFNDYFGTIRMLLSDTIFVGAISISGIVYSGVFIMFNELSSVLQLEYDMNVLQTGLYTGFVIAGLLIGSALSIILTRFCKLTSIRIVMIGIAIVVIVAIILMLPFIMDTMSINDISIWWTIAPLCFYVMGDGLMLPNLIATALEPYKESAGTASSLAGFWRFFSGALIAMLVSGISNKHLQVLHIGMSCMAILALIVFLIIAVIRAYRGQINLVNRVLNVNIE